MSISPETLVGQTAEDLQRTVGFPVDPNYLDLLAREVVRGLSWSQALSRIYRDYGHLELSIRYQEPSTAQRQREHHASLYDPYDGRVTEFTWVEEPQNRLFRFNDGYCVTYLALDAHDPKACRVFMCRECMVERGVLELSYNAGQQIRELLQMSLSTNEARRLLGLDPIEFGPVDKPVTKEPDPPVLVFGVRRIVLE